MKTDQKFYETRDINLASVLVTIGFQLEQIDMQLEGNEDKKVGYFNFKETDALKQIEKEYWQKKVLVEPREFMSNLRALKSQVQNFYKAPSYNTK